MKITSKKDAIHVHKPEGPDVWYYLFPEYEVHYNEQPPKSGQVWHRHEHIDESIFIFEGSLVAMWKENGEDKEQVVGAGDFIQSENTDHTYENRTDKPVKFLVIKQLLTGEDKREILKNDKVLS
jgi:uncharacterized cupin superfamily protein